MVDFKSLYRQACAVNGTPTNCNYAIGTKISWANTTAAASAAFGSGSARAIDWASRGDVHGVNY